MNHYSVSPQTFGAAIAITRDKAKKYQFNKNRLDAIDLCHYYVEDKRDNKDGYVKANKELSHFNVKIEDKYIYVNVPEKFKGLIDNLASKFGIELQEGLSKQNGLGIYYRSDIQPNDISEESYFGKDAVRDNMVKMSKKGLIGRFFAEKNLQRALDKQA